MHQPNSSGKPDDSGVKGFTFKVKTPEESCNGEDSFYYCEYEPFMNYLLRIDDLKEDTAEVYMNGVVITDCYYDPYETKEFEIHCVVPYK